LRGSLLDSAYVVFGCVDFGAADFKMGKEVRFGILGCASIARSLVRAMLFIPEIKIHAIASRSLEKAQAFALKTNAPKDTKLYGSYDELLNDEEVDAVYVPLPSGLHVEWVLKAAEKKKHVLLEKPPAPTVQELDVILSALHKNGLQYMDGTMWMHHPRAAEMHKVIHDKELIGDILEVSFTYSRNQ
jgi:predicted dehydrogenase